MSIATTGQNNPYIIGRPIHEPEFFFGREDLFEFIQDNLLKDSKVILLHGQRRIGKSSVLSQIPNFVRSERFFFIPLSLEGRSRKSLNFVLYELALEIRDYLEDEIKNLLKQIDVPTKKDFQTNYQVFSEKFLPQVFQILAGKNLVLLLDEFDVMSNQSQNIDTASKHFFRYLKFILDEQEKLQLQNKTQSSYLRRERNSLELENYDYDGKLFLIPVVGRQLDDMPNLLGLFREAPNQNIGLLQKSNAEKLITEPAKDFLTYQPDAINAILELSAGHPYFTQVICFAVFSQARSNQKWTVTRKDVYNTIEQAIEIGEAGLTWFRDGLPPAEQVVFSAVAQSQEQTKSSYGEPLQLLGKYGVVPTEHIKQAGKRLVEWGFLEFVENSIPNPIDTTDTLIYLDKYKIKIELVRLWLVKQYSLRKDIWSLETLDSEAQLVYEATIKLRNRKGIEKNIAKLYEQIIEIYPNHFSALLDMANASLKSKNFEQAVKLYERVFRIEPVRIRDEYIQALVSYGTEQKDDNQLKLAEEQFKKLLEIEPDNKYALEQLAKIESSKQSKNLFGRYQIEKLLGKGGFSETYLVRDKQGFDRFMVAKKLKLFYTDSSIIESIERLFRREYEVLERLGNHPQIPQTFAFFEEQNEFYLIQEYIEGQSLAEELEQAINEKSVVDLLKEILKILTFVHQNNIIHRDIKPDNFIRRKRDNKLVLIDFGAVKEILASESEYSTRIGTNGYAAPEQILGRPTFSSDIYAVGIIAIQALTGIYPNQFPQSETGEIIWRERASVSSNIARIIDKMVNTSPSLRYQSADEVITDIESLNNEKYASTTFVENQPIVIKSREDRSLSDVLEKVAITEIKRSSKSSSFWNNRFTFIVFVVIVSMLASISSNVILFNDVILKDPSQHNQN